MRAVIGGVATLDPELYGHGPITGDRENIKQLLEVGAVVLVVAVGDGQAEMPAEGAFVLGILVVAGEGHGGGVVVQFVELDAELAHGVCGDVEDERGDVGIEDAVEGSSHAVVVQRVELLGSHAEEFREVARGPLANAIEGLA